jgi:hypothetical protein
MFALEKPRGVGILLGPRWSEARGHAPMENVLAIGCRRILSLSSELSERYSSLKHLTP